MATINGPGGIDIQRLPVSTERRIFGPWKITLTRSHILHSKCSKDEESCVTDPCDFCIYNNTLKLRHLPDMVFPKNTLILEHNNGGKIEFNALDALKRVDDGKTNLQLPCAEAWKESRPNCEVLQETKKPFDWTFTTDYMGTLTDIDVEDTEDKIDFNALTKREQILLYHHLTLYEDEVHDNGIASLSLKIRVMPNSLFILLRYFLRIDHSTVRINDTRIYNNFENPHLIREYTSRESRIHELKVPLSLLLDPSLIAPQLPIKHSHYQKLIIPPLLEDVKQKM